MTVITGPIHDSADQPANGYLYVEQWYRSELNGTLITDNPAKGIVKDGELYLDDGVTPFTVPASPLGGGTRMIEDFRPFSRQVVRNVIIPENGPVQYATLQEVSAPIGSSTFIIPGALRSFIEKADGVGDALQAAQGILADVEETADGFDDTVAAASAAIDAKAAEIDGLVATNDGIMTAVAADPGSDFAGALSATFLAKEEPGYDVFLLAGQSNMSGRGYVYDQRLDPSDSKVYQYGNSGVYANVIAQAFEPLAMHDVPNGIGPGLGFARWYASSIAGGRRVLLVPTAHGGTSLSSNAALAWRPGVTGNLFANSVAQTNAALAAAGAGARLKGILWVQGESDGDNGISGTQYQTDFDALIDAYRSAFGVADLPFIVGQMVPEYLPIGTRNAINAVHASVQSRKAHTAFWQGAIGQNDADFNHYNAIAQRRHGRSAYLAYQRAVAETSDPALPAAPGKPGGLAASAVTSSTLTLSWTSVAAAAYYLIQKKLSSSGTWANLTATGGTSVNVGGLAVSSSNDFRVIPVNNGGAGTWSDTLTVSTGAPITPGTPSGLAVGAVTFSQVALSWTAAADSTSYLPQYRKVGDATWLDASSVPGTSATINVPLPSTAYEFRITAYNAATPGTPSSTVSATTAAAPPATALGVVGAVNSAYSISRRVVSNYSGPLVRVRRNSDNTEQDIGADGAGALDTAALDAFAGNSASAWVTRMYDQSGNSRDISNATLGAQPRIKDGTGVLYTSGGKAACVFDGTDDVLFKSSANGLYASASGVTAMVVLRSSATSGGNQRAWAESVSTLSGEQYGLAQPDAAAGMAKAVIYNSAGSIAMTAGTHPAYNATIHQIAATDDLTHARQWVDGVADDDGSTYARGTVSTAKDRFAVGGVVRSGSLAPISMFFSEAVFFDRVLGSTDLATAQGDQKTFFGTP